MPSVQIKDVPVDTHAVLRRRAASSHQTLQEYLRSRLIEDAATPTLDEVLGEIDGRTGGEPRSPPWSTCCATTVLVVDASVLVPALADDGADGTSFRLRLRGERLAAPELIDLGVCSVLRRLALSAGLSAERASTALADLGRLPLRRASHTALLGRCWELRDTINAYDASYVALAEALGAALVTADRRLARASGPRCRIEVLPASS